MGIIRRLWSRCCYFHCCCCFCPPFFPNLLDNKDQRLFYLSTHLCSVLLAFPLQKIDSIGDPYCPNGFAPPSPPPAPPPTPVSPPPADCSALGLSITTFFEAVPFQFEASVVEGLEPPFQRILIAPSITNNGPAPIDLKLVRIPFIMDQFVKSFEGTHVERIQVFCIALDTSTSASLHTCKIKGKRNDDADFVFSKEKKAFFFLLGERKEWKTVMMIMIIIVR